MPEHDYPFLFRERRTRQMAGAHESKKYQSSPSRDIEWATTNRQKRAAQIRDFPKSLCIYFYTISKKCQLKDTVYRRFFGMNLNLNDYNQRILDTKEVFVDLL